jgi:hypothetical protein
MTSYPPVVDDSFLKVFSSILKKQNYTLLERISKDYNIDLQTLTSKYITGNSIRFLNRDVEEEVIPTTKKKYKERLKQNEIIFDNSEVNYDLCLAKIWNPGNIIKQCHYKKIKDCKYCKTHDRMSRTILGIKYGSYE